MKNFSRGVSLTKIILINAVVTIGIFLLGIGILSVNRSEVFDHFASGYLERVQEDAATEDEVDNVERQLFSEEAQVVQTVQQVNPAVVSIVVTKSVPQVENFYEYFGPFRFEVPRIEGEEEQEIGGGSGFIVSEDGLIVTNRHVVADEEANYTAFTNDGEKYELTVIGRDPFLDIAVLKMRNAEGLSHLEFGDSDKLSLGQTVIAIGNALGEFRNSVSVGVVSGLSRSIRAGSQFGGSELLEQVIQTDAAINPGNSGGPLVNLEGKVVGVNVAVALGSENIGFALPSNAVEQVVGSVRQYGEIVRPYLGIRYVMLTDEVVEGRQLPVENGALIVSGNFREPAVLPGSPAAEAGVREGDVITHINEEELTERRSLASVIREYQVGDTVSLTIMREGRTLMRDVVLGRAPSDLN